MIFETLQFPLPIYAKDSLMLFLACNYMYISKKLLNVDFEKN